MTQTAPVARSVPADAAPLPGPGLDQDDAKRGSYHYGLVARALRIIDADPAAASSLERLAGQLGMSPAHFQRVFSRWVGVSPKRYQQYLQLGHAKALLAGRRSLLDSALDSGLSGTGRLHDMFIQWEAMTPGAYARRGAGLTIRQGWFDSPFGEVLAMGTERGLCGLAFAAETGAGPARADLAARWPAAAFVDDPATLAPWVAAAFDPRGARAGGGAPLHLAGAPFQIKVWEALLAIPSGAVSTYGDIARAIGHPQAVRAVGTAVGRNPLAWLIPCHRAMRAGGGLGGYHWGLPVKRAMLAWESARADAP